MLRNWMGDKYWGLLTGVLGAALFAYMAVFVRLCGDQLSFGQILFVRSLVAILVLGIMYRREIGSLLNRQARPVWLRSIFGGLSAACYFVNIRSSSVGMATLLTDLSPIFVIVLSAVLFQRGISIKALAGTFIATLGVAVLSIPKGNHIDLSILLLGLISAVSGAFAYISLKRVAGKYSSGSVVFCFSFVLLFVSFFDPNLFSFQVSNLTLWPILGMAISSLLAQLLMTISYRFLSAAMASSLNLSSVVWAFVCDVAIFDMHFSLISVFAAAIVLVGLYVCSRAQLATVD